MPVNGGELLVPNISLHELLWQRFQQYGDDVAFVDASKNGESITYRDIYRQSRKCATYLQSQGIQKGDVIAIGAPNCLEYTFLIPGILGSGAIVTPCNPYYKPGEILQQFRISEPKMMFVSEEALDTMKAVKAELPCLKKLVVIGKSDEFPALHEVLSRTDEATLKEVGIHPAEDIAVIVQSGGTTGLPKAVAMTHRNYVASNILKHPWTMERSRITAKVNEVDEETPVRDPTSAAYVERPMYHTAGVALVVGLAAAGTKCVFESDFDVVKMLKTVEKYQVTVAVCVPPMVIDLVNAEGVEKYDLSHLREICCGGAVLAPDLIRRIMEKYQVALRPLYSMTEASIICVGMIPGNNIASCGNLQRGVELKIVDLESRHECGPEKEGEILIRSAQVMKGYLKNPRATTNAIDKDGWFKTGDIGYLGHDEQLYIVDRLKDVIRYRSFQVSPAELESVILKHPKVLDVGVVGIPDEASGELPKALVVRKDADLTSDEVHKIVEEHLVDYKHLRGGVQFVDRIPKSLLGKIRRNLLKKMATE